MKKSINEKPLVSVIMPCYNVSEFVEKAILSVFEQTYSNIELVCVDDGSSDNTYEIISTYAKQYNIKLIRQTNQGILEARRTAINNASGSYIALCDADDSLENTAIEKSIDIIFKNECDAVSWEFYGDDGMNQSPLLTYEQDVEIISGLEAFKGSIDNWELTGIGLFKKSKYQESYKTLEEINLKADNADEFITRVVFLGLSSIAKAKIKYFYFINQESSTKKFKLSWATAIDTDKAIYQFICVNNLYHCLKIKIINRFITDILRLRKSIRKHKTEISKNDKKILIEKCKEGADIFKYTDYFFWFFNSRMSLKHKLRFIYSIFFLK